MKKILLSLGFTLLFGYAQATLTTPANVSPGIGAINVAPNTVLDWSASTGATAYEYKLSNNPITVADPAFTVAASQANTANLLFGTFYYWQVRAIKTTLPLDSSAWSAVWLFITIDNITLVAPVNGSVNQAPVVTLDWGAMTGNSAYDYQYDTTLQFNSPLNYYGSTNAGYSEANTTQLLFGTTYYWRARARHATDTTQWSSIWSFTTIDNITLVSPVNNSVSIGLNPLIDWTTLSGISGFQYEISADAMFTNPILYTIGTTSQANLSNLSYGTTYYWHVRATHATDTSEWSATWNFTTVYQLTGIPTLLSPTNGLLQVTVAGTLMEWASFNGATIYEVQYDDNNLFSSPVINNTMNVNQPTANLLSNTTYYWRVRAGNGSGFSAWSATWMFSTEVLFTGVPQLVSPLLGATNIPQTGITLQWTTVAGASNYEVQYDVDGLFSNPTSTITSSLFNLTATLASNTIYYWRVRASDGVNFANWSPIWNFTTELSNSIALNEASNALFLYPTICNDFLNISAQQFLVGDAFALYNSEGKQVLKGTIENQKSTLSVKHLNAGVYYFKVLKSDFKAIKIIKN